MSTYNNDEDFMDLLEEIDNILTPPLSYSSSVSPVPVTAISSSSSSSLLSPLSPPLDWYTPPCTVGSPLNLDLDELLNFSIENTKKQLKNNNSNSIESIFDHLSNTSDHHQQQSPPQVQLVATNTIEIPNEISNDLFILINNNNNYVPILCNSNNSKINEINIKSDESTEYTEKDSTQTTDGSTIPITTIEIVNDEFDKENEMKKQLLKENLTDLISSILSKELRKIKNNLNHPKRMKRMRNYFLKSENIINLPRGPKYTCFECIEMFNTKFSLLTHMKLHRKPFCAICHLFFDEINEMQLHMERCSTECNKFLAVPKRKPNAKSIGLTMFVPPDHSDNTAMYASRPNAGQNEIIPLFNYKVITNGNDYQLSDQPERPILESFEYEQQIQSLKKKITPKKNPPLKATIKKLKKYKDYYKYKELNVVRAKVKYSK